mgnify:CR=1 FL=1
MLFEIEECCFAHTTNSSDLLGLVKAVLRGCHGVLVVDESAADYTTWLERQTEEIREEWSLALASTARSQARAPSSKTARVAHDADPNFQDDLLQIPPREAEKLSRHAFQIFVENDFADTNFLKAFANSDQLETINELESQGFVEFNHCGGITEMPRRLSARLQRHPANRHFIAAVFDSDSLEPQSPSNDASSVMQCCEERNIPSFCLDRRAIENYLPVWALSGWANCHRGKSRTRLIRAKDAFSRLSEAQRNHYNLKSGLKGDGQRLSQTTWGQLEEKDRVPLLGGFGRQVANLFGEPHVRDNLSAKDSGWQEVNGVVVAILGLVR